MNTDTPTPRTNAGTYKSEEQGEVFEYVLFNVAQQLERELTAVTEQLDSYKERYTKLAGKYAIEMHEITEQRDRLAEDLRLISNGTSCRECGGEDQALFARESLQTLTPKS
jgi:hypothetical protein